MRRDGERPRAGRLAGRVDKPAAARLLPVHRLLAIVLLALLPLQFSWAAVASYCAHEVDGTGHFGHHTHHHHHGAGAPGVDPAADDDASPDKAADPVGVDCGHCHGTFSVIPMLQAALPDVPASALPRAGASPGGGAHAPEPPERPQWQPLA